MMNQISFNGIGAIYSILKASEMTYDRCREYYEQMSATNFSSLSTLKIREFHITQLLAFLLNPDEAHHQKDKFLKLFFSMLNYNLDELGELQCIQAEYNTNTGSRFDIYIEFTNKCFVIENKIWGSDTENQLKKYIEWLETLNKNFEIIYLNMNGTPPKHLSGEMQKSIKIISYRDEIQKWLRQCITQCNALNITACLNDFLKWIELNVGNKEVKMVIGDTFISILTEERHKRDFEMLYHINQTFNHLESYIHEKCIPDLNDKLLCSLNDKLPNYNIQLNGLDDSSKMLFGNKQSWIEIYKPDWVFNNSPVIFYAIEVYSPESMPVIGISRAEKNQEYIQEEDLVKAAKQLAERHNKPLAAKMTSWWIAQMNVPLPNTWNEEEDYTIERDWHLSNSDARNNWVKLIVDATLELVRLTEDVMDNVASDAIAKKTKTIKA